METRMFLCFHVVKIYMKAQKHACFHVVSPFSAHLYIIKDKGLYQARFE